jgi:hypothetical protein
MIGTPERPKVKSKPGKLKILSKRRTDGVMQSSTKELDRMNLLMLTAVGDVKLA